MPAAGAKPKPTALKQLQGTARADRVNKSEPAPSGPIGNPPTNLSAAEKRTWRWVVEVMPMVLTAADRDQLELYCVLRCWVREQMKDNGKPPTPEIVQVRQLAASFGLDPASRTRLTAAPEPKDADPFADLLQQGRRDN